MNMTMAKGRRGFTPAHGQSRTRAYRCWVRMKQLCDYERAPGYAYVGARGITYDPAWKDYGAFHADMGDCPDGHSLKRIDGTQGYRKGNCTWGPIRKATPT